MAYAPAAWLQAWTRLPRASQGNGMGGVSGAACAVRAPALTAAHLSFKCNLALFARQSVDAAAWIGAQDTSTKEPCLPIDTRACGGGSL